MKPLLTLAVIVLTACNTGLDKHVNAFTDSFPDTSKTWAGEVTHDDYRRTRSLEKNLHLSPLTGGAKQYELRMWNLSSSYDPQVVFMLTKNQENLWSLRTLSFYSSKGDSIYADYTRPIRSGTVDSLRLDRYWSLASQSDLKAGDSYGCMDGENVLIELADSTRYRVLWYRCPNINKDKDSVFRLANNLVNKLDGLAVEH
jgi:hypothetical protein